MKTLLIDREFAYDGTQLRSLYGYFEHRILGDSAVAWIGSCDVSFDHMVDGEDFLAGAEIRGARMLHFVIEKFHTPLFSAVTLQRLFASICLELLREQIEEPGIAAKLRREGDDVFFGEGKLSISIATSSPVSSLIHFAINCTNQGTPVKTASFEDLSIDPREFAAAALKKLASEVASIEEATMKVRWVK